MLVEDKLFNLQVHSSCEEPTPYSWLRFSDLTKKFVHNEELIPYRVPELIRGQQKISITGPTEPLVADPEGFVNQKSTRPN